MGTTTTARSLVSTGAESQSDEDFTSSYRSSLGQLVGYFRAKGVPREEAADLANESMVRMLVHLKRHGRDRTDLGPLVRTIARNLLVERIRKASPVVVPLVDDMDVADDALEPADELLASERRDAVRDAIRSLSPRHRHVVGLWMDGRTPIEIARVLGIKRNAVDAILHRARRSLAAKLDGGGVLGFAAIMGLRLRMLVRRATEHIVSADPAGHGVATASGIFAVGLAAVVSFSPAGSAVQHPTAPHSEARLATMASDVSDGSARAVARSDAVSIRDSARTIRTSTREISTTIPTGGGDPVRVGVAERTKDDGRESVLGPILSRVVTENACGVDAGLCSGD